MVYDGLKKHWTPRRVILLVNVIWEKEREGGKSVCVRMLGVGGCTNLYYAVLKGALWYILFGGLFQDNCSRIVC